MDNSLIDQIRQSNDIVEVIGGYIPLKRMGSNYRGVCPFHNDTNPSMHVSQPKQIFKCFACGKAGNVYTFVQEYEHISFMEAVKKLAQRAGIILPEYENTKKVTTKRDLLLHVYKSAKDYFVSNLFNHGTQVLDYLKSRKFSPETAKQLELGYALNSEKGLLNHLMKEGINVALLKESGLFANYQGNMTDLYRDRLMFPIHNSIGEVIAYGGRIMNKNSEAGKYINSPGTELYTKGKELYGLFKTKYEISKAKYALVCEGYFDFLRLYESGFTNSVASLGTALTEDQIYLLARYCETIYMIYDGDAAGQKAAVRGALLALSMGISAKIVHLPPEHDPDSFILANGIEALKTKIDEAQGVIEYYARNTQKGITVEERINLLLDSVRTVKDPIKKELLVRDISEAFRISEASLNTKLRNTSRPQPTYNAPQTVVENVFTDNNEERYILILALKDKESYNLFANELSEDYFFNMGYKNLYRFLVQQDWSDAIDNPSMLLDATDDDTDLKESLADILFEELPLMRFKDTLNQVKIRKLQSDLEAIDRKIEKDTQDVELLKQKEALSRTYRRMTKKVVNRLIH